MKFKVGDRVRIVGHDMDGSCEQLGGKGVVDFVGADGYSVRFTDPTSPIGFFCKAFAYGNLAGLDQATIPKGDARLHALLKEIGDLHDKKQVDYGTEGDPFANCRASEAFGIPAWVGVLVRANDKMKRLQKAAKSQTLVNESVEDSFMDLAVYSLIGLLLFRETKEAA